MTVALGLYFLLLKSVRATKSPDTVYRWLAFAAVSQVAVSPEVSHNASLSLTSCCRLDSCKFDSCMAISPYFILLGDGVMSGTHKPTSWALIKSGIYIRGVFIHAYTLARIPLAPRASAYGCPMTLVPVLICNFRTGRTKCGPSSCTIRSESSGFRCFLRHRHPPHRSRPQSAALATPSVCSRMHTECGAFILLSRQMCQHAPHHNSIPLAAHLTQSLSIAYYSPSGQFLGGAAYPVPAVGLTYLCMSSSY